MRVHIGDEFPAAPAAAAAAALPAGPWRCPLHDKPLISLCMNCADRGDPNAACCAQCLRSAHRDCTDFADDWSAVLEKAGSLVWCNSELGRILS